MTKNFYQLTHLTYPQQTIINLPQIHLFLSTVILSSKFLPCQGPHQGQKDVGEETTLWTIDLGSKVGHRARKLGVYEIDLVL